MLTGAPSVVLSYYKKRLSCKRCLSSSISMDLGRLVSVVITCFAEGYGYRRTFVLAALDAGYLNDEYLYIMAEPNSNGFCEFAVM